MSESAATIIGVNFEASTAYLAAVGEDEELLLDQVVPKLEVPSNVSDWLALHRFAGRFLSEAKRANASHVVVADPRRANRWVYSQAFTRVSAHVAAGLLLSDAGIRVSSVAQRTAAATLGIPLRKLESGLAALLGVDTGEVIHWKPRSRALAVALHQARVRAS